MQTTNEIHPDRYSHIAAQERKFKDLICQLRRRSAVRAKEIVKIYVAFLAEEDYAQPIQAIQHELQALDTNAYFDEVSEMRHG